MRFYNRKRELAVLHEAVEQKGSAIIVISGRRRVGKTRLVDEFLDKIGGLKITIVPKEEKMVAKDFEELFAEGFRPMFNSVKEALEYFFAKSDDRILYIDEFPNFLDVNSAIPYELQRLWDTYKNKTNKLLILSGSYVSMMEKIFTVQKAPLFNRASFKIILDPLEFNFVFDMQDEIGIKDPVKKVINYCIFGGIPYYYEVIEKFGGHASIENLFFGIGQLREEGQDILRQEFGSKYKKYFSILEAIGSGLVSAGEIANRLGIAQTTLSKYIQSLQNDFKLIERKVPFGDNPNRSKKGTYLLKDNLLAFWFSTVYGKLQPPDGNTLNIFVSRRFESFCINFIINELKAKGEKILKYGQWYGNVEIEGGKFERREIDLVVETDKNLYIGECKWNNNKIGYAELERLKNSAKILISNKPVKWILFSKSGFNIEQTKDIVLFDIKKLTSS